MSVYNEYQKNWYQKKWRQARPLKEYIDYIEKLKHIDMLECMVKCNVPILTASDAHLPQNVGLYIKEMNNLLQTI